MVRFKFNKESSIASVLYILERTGRLDFHKLFKILYFAEQKHLALYGKPITGDHYIAMPAGPVPSVIYDILKSVRDKDDYPVNYKEFEHLFVVEGNYYVKALVGSDTDNLSESSTELLNDSIKENKDLSFSQLKEKSHDTAWGMADANYEINYEDIAACGGANDVILKYMKTSSENQTSSLY